MSELKKQAQADLNMLMKLGAMPGLATPLADKARLDWLKGVVKPILGTLAAVGSTGLATYYFTKKDKERHQHDLMSSMKSLATKNPDFGKDPGKFMERFSELTVISPTIAKNPTLAAKLLEKKMTSGFSVDDIHKLTSIEHNASTARHFNPAAAGRASAYHALNTLTNAFGKDVLDQQRLNTATYNKRMEEAEEASMEAAMARAEARMNKEEGHMKKSSAQRVSDECLGIMLGERYMLFKTAGVADYMAAGAKSMGRGMALFAPALALGGGAALIRHVMEAKRTAALEQQADMNFKNIVRKSDRFTGPENMQLAREAFETLKAVAPSLAARELVAKTFIEHTVGQGIMPPETVQQLADAENTLRGIGSSKGSFFSDLKSTMGLMDPKTIGKFDIKPKVTKSGL